MTVTNCLLKSSSSGIRIGYGPHPIRRCIFSNIVIYDSYRGIGIFAHDDSNIEDLIFSDIIIETCLYNGQWWRHGEPIHLSCISWFPGQVAGQIKNVQFNNLQLRMRKVKETMAYGGNFDPQPASPPEMQIFEHDIPGIYAQNVKNLAIRDFNLIWSNDLPSFFTNGIVCKDVTDLLFDGFSGTANPNSPGSQKIKLENSTIRNETK